MLKPVFTLSIALLFTSAMACRGPQSEDYVLLDALPRSALDQAVVAKVVVVTRREQSAIVKVVEAIQGVDSGDLLSIHTSGTSCSWLDARSRFFQTNPSDPKSKVQNFYYIAGDWKPDSRHGNKKLFSGAWRSEIRVH